MRLRWLPAVSLLAALVLLPAPGAEAKQVVVLGFDGLDPDILQDLIDEGRVPNLARMAKTGQFAPLGTSIPPQSPVAWSNFITGQDAGGHGIFDFLHRDPDTMLPYLSTSKPGRFRLPSHSTNQPAYRWSLTETIRNNSDMVYIIHYLVIHFRLPLPQHVQAALGRGNSRTLTDPHPTDCPCMGISISLSSRQGVCEVYF